MSVTENQVINGLMKPKMMSENERLDHQMRYGTDYVNLPAQLFPTDRAPTWIQQDESLNTNETKPSENRFLHHLRPSTTGSQVRRTHYANHQQMDAENRLRHLETIRPKENINLLNVKFHSLQHPRHARPILPQYRDDYVNTFYDQTGSYVQERAGLYHTENYEPYALVQAMPELGNQEQNYSQMDKTNPNLFQYKAIGDYQNMRNHLLNKLRTSHDAGTIDGRTQEGQKQFVQSETIYGLSYNTPKFLQENTLAGHARTDPSSLMSTRYNGNLGRVRSLNSYPTKATDNTKQEKSNDTALVSPLLYPSIYDEIYSTNSIGEHTNGYSRRSTVRVYDSPFHSKSTPNMKQFSQQSLPAQSNSFDPKLSIPTQIPRSIKTLISLPGPEIVARSLEPNSSPLTTYQRSFKDISYHEKPQKQQSFKENNQRLLDNRFQQWKLKDIQDGWSKTQAQRQYHFEHPEPVPDVGGCTIRARKELLIADTILKKQQMTVR